MVNIKNTLTSNIKVVVIREVSTILAPDEQSDITVGSDERVEIQPNT